MKIYKVLEVTEAKPVSKDADFDFEFEYMDLGGLLNWCKGFYHIDSKNKNRRLNMKLIEMYNHFQLHDYINIWVVGENENYLIINKFD